MAFSRDVLRIDAARVVADISTALARQVNETLRRKGLVIALSGGVDSAVVAGLAARALGSSRVLGLLMRERDSPPGSLEFGKLVADAFGIPLVVEDLTSALEGLRCYARQRAAIREVFPAYGEGWSCQLELPPMLDGEPMNILHLTVRAPGGSVWTSRLPHEPYRLLVAATNMKQRVRKATEYYHSDRLGYAVAGTVNRLEYDQGLFAKHAADVTPIAHLFKTQVHAIAEHLGVPEVVRSRPPAADTLSTDVTQDELLSALPYDTMDLCLWAYDRGFSAEEVAPELGLVPEQIESVFRDIQSKRRGTRYLHAPALLIETPDSEV